MPRPTKPPAHEVAKAMALADRFYPPSTENPITRWRERAERLEEEASETAAVLIEALGGQAAWDDLKRREGAHWSIPLPEMARAVLKELGARK